MPGTWAASSAARERAASLVTVPLSVAICFWTDGWMASVVRALSPDMRVWRAAVRLASSVGGGELLQPAKPRATARAAAARVACVAERFLLAYMGPLCW